MLGCRSDEVSGGFKHTETESGMGVQGPGPGVGSERLTGTEAQVRKMGRSGDDGGDGCTSV